MAFFSIIIPVYNAERYLEKCLASVDSQTFSDYEVILVDDGSTDQSLSICKRYEQNNKKFRVIHQSNSGPSVARNVGLDAAEGEWICFVDSDDCIEADYLHAILEAVHQYDADIVFIGHNKVFPNGKKEVFLPREVSDTKIKTVLDLSECDMFGYTWVKAFRTEAIKDLRFDPALNLFEDEVFICHAVSKIGKIGVVRKPIYNYSIGDGSSLIGRTHEDYCLLCDKVYEAWKAMLADVQESRDILTKIANRFVSRCYYYAFERQINLQNYFSQLKETAYFKEHTEINKYDKAVQDGDYRKLRIERIKYQTKVTISTALNRKR